VDGAFAPHAGCTRGVQVAHHLRDRLLTRTVRVEGDDRRPLPTNQGPTRDRLLRFRDCAVLNAYLGYCAREGRAYDTVRGGFTEGPPAFPGAGIRAKTHIQVGVPVATG
jgi:hypothetical protein